MTLDLLALIALSWYCIVWAIGLLGWHIASVLSVPPSTPVFDAKEAPGVTVLRPLCGLDDNLYENLESSFLQSYPTYEIIFCVAEERDQAIPIVHALLSRYTKVKARLIIGESQIGANPKINNLARGYREAEHDIVWILDSNSITKADTLARSVAALQQPGAGLVHHVPFAMYPGIEMGGRLDQAFLNTTHAKMYLAINWTAIDSCLMGKSNMFRKSDLERSIPVYKPLIKAGTSQKPGLEAFGCFLGEDNFIGRTLWHGGKLKHVMTENVVGNTVGGMQWQSYFWRRVRWIRIRKYMTPFATLLEPLQESIVVGVLGTVALYRLFGLPAWLIFLLHEIAWYHIDTSVFSSLLKASPAATPPRSVYEKPRGLAFIQPWMMRELLALPIWAVAMFGGSMIAWRGTGKRYRLHWDGTVSIEDVVQKGLPLNR